LDTHLENHDYLVDGRFTIADIAVGYALYLACLLQLNTFFQPQTRSYIERLIKRPAFQRADGIAGPMVLPAR
jgi:glutathione S-transferase